MSTLGVSILQFILSILTTSPVSPNTSNPNNPTTLKEFMDSELYEFQVEIIIIVKDCWHNTDPVVSHWVFEFDSAELEDIFVITGCAAQVNGLII